MDREAQPALETSDVILEEVGVFVEVDSFERELPQSFSSVCVGGALRSDSSTSEFTSCSILVVHVKKEGVGMDDRVRVCLCCESTIRRKSDAGKAGLFEILQPGLGSRLIKTLD